MKVTFLGTGTSQGVPMIGCKCAVCQSDDHRDNRLRTSILVSHNDKNVVIDTGPDFRQQMLRTNTESLDAVIFTHEHKDHIAGLDDVRAYNYLQRRPMDIFATERVQSALKREFAYVFSGVEYPGIPKLNLKNIHPDSAFEVAGIEFLPLPVMHMNLPVLGFRIGDFSYITDANLIPDSTKELIKGSKYLVLNALRTEKHISHFTLDEALEIIKEVNPEKAFLTHISHQLGKYEDVERLLPEGVSCAYDGLVVKMDS